MIENQVILSTSVPLLQKKFIKRNVYCATKHAVDALNQGMRMDLNPFGIRVGAIHPGMVQTEFSEVRFKGDTDRAEKYIKGSCPYNQKISPTSFTLWYRDRIISTLPI
jgi:NADP-dependent 3-hydroxy acid dehydrogenase YdfG